MMKHLYIILIIIGISLASFAGVTAATKLYPGGGGTGTSTVPAYGEILVGQGDGTYGPQATSTLGIIGIGSGDPFSFTPTTYNGVGVVSTSTGLWLTATSPFSLVASSTFITNASTSQISADTSYLGTVLTGTWNGTAIGDAYVDDDITLTNITQITNRAITDTTGTLTVARGGTGQTNFGQGWLHSDGTTLTSSTSPTVNYITATSTTATSTLPRLSITTGISILGEYFENFTTYVRSLFTAGTGINISSGSISATLGTSIDAGEITAGAIDGDDINSNIAGRSLTLTSASPDTLDVDSELYTHSMTFSVASSSLATTTNLMAHKVSKAITITEVSGHCFNQGTTTIDIEQNGTTIFQTGQFWQGFFVEADGSATTSTSFADATVPAGSWLTYDIEGWNVGSPTNCVTTIKYTSDD